MTGFGTIRLWFCKVCRRAYEVTGSPEELQLFGEDSQYPCITPLCRGRIHRVTSMEEWRRCSTSDIEAISPRSFFRAVMGFGKFEGAPAEKNKVVELLMSNNIVRVDAEPVGTPERTIVHQIVMTDGTRLHFGSSSHGACCYYIESPGPSCVEVLDNEQRDLVRDEAAAEGSNSDREEAGRGSGRSGVPGNEGIGNPEDQSSP